MFFHINRLAFNICFYFCLMWMHIVGMLQHFSQFHNLNDSCPIYNLGNDLEVLHNDQLHRIDVQFHG